MRTIGTLMLAGVVATAARTASACPNCKRGYLFGKPVAIGNGMAWTWAKLVPGSEKVESMGVTFTETALEGLPALADQKMPMAEYMLELPEKIKGKPFDHVMLNWAPVGHDPFPLYGKPHFDLHFFMMSPEKTKQITAKGDDLKKCNKKPSADYVPAGYIMPPGTVIPTMGAHWIDPKSKEFHGKEFDSTFIYGSYDGKINFIEPMITTKLLAGKPNFTEPISAPKSVEISGFYPTSYSIKYNADRKEVSVSLDNLQLVKATKPKAEIAKKK